MIFQCYPIYSYVISEISGCDLTYGNICYTHHNNRLTWQQASDACSEFGGHLVDIEDDGEQEILSTIGNCK